MRSLLTASNPVTTGGARDPVENFIDWLERPATERAYADSIAMLTQRSILEGDLSLVENAKHAIAELMNGFAAEWEGLVALAKDEGLQEAGKSRMAVELRRMCGEFLLGSLADRGFLPGHGFPTNVVSFIPGKEFKSVQDAPQDGTRQFRTVGPRGLSTLRSATTPRVRRSFSMDSFTSRPA